MFAFANILTHLSVFSSRFAHQDRFDHLFSLSDRELTHKGLNRDALVRSYVTGLAAY